MDFVKGAIDGQVDKVIDQAADVAKEKVGQLIGSGDKKKQEQEQGGKGIGDLVSGVAGNALADKAAEGAADQAMAFGKSLFK